MFPLISLVVVTLGLPRVDPTGAPRCVKEMCLPANYQKFEASTEQSKIKVNMDILDILSVNDKEFSVTFSSYFSVEWEETRLVINRTIQEGHWEEVPLEFLDHLWVPNIYIYDLKSFQSFEVLKKLAGVWIIGGKSVFYNQFVSVTFQCPMRFSWYPADEHICKFRIGDTTNSIHKVVFGDIQLHFNDITRNTILDYEVQVVNLRENDRLLMDDGRNYSITGFEMKLTRKIWQYVYIYYLPSGLFVALSWISFLIPEEEVLARLALLITMFLKLINMFNTTTTNSPNVEGMTALAAWMLVCIFFVFVAITCYSCLLWMKKQCCAKRKRPRAQTEEERTPRKENYKCRVDVVFLMVFPSMFLLFNLIYWIILI